MTESSPTRTAICANQLAQAAAAMAAHCDRLGIQFWPRPSAAGVANWTSQLAAGEAVGAELEPTVAAPVVASASVSEPMPLVEPIQQVIAPAVLPVASTGESLPVAERESQLAQWAAAVSQCTRCEALVKCRSRTVFGEGNAAPRVAFFGEGPGAEEDRSGRPFVGPAGQLLTKMIQACTFRREDVYILNTVKCRPPGNRNPEPSEIQNCREYFVTQLDILRPEYIVCLGAVSSQALLDSTLPVGRLRGKFHNYRGSKVVVTYHPAYLLRNPSAKKAAWDDLQMMLRDMGITPAR